MNKLAVVFLFVFFALCASQESRPDLKPGVTVARKGSTITFVAIGKSSAEIAEPLKRERLSCDAAKILAHQKIRETFPDIKNILMLVVMKETRNLQKGVFCRIEYEYSEPALK